MTAEMTAEHELLEETLDALFDRNCTPEARREAADGAVPAGLWRVLADTGLTDLTDAGADLPEHVVLARATGRAAAPVPLVEAAGLASWIGSGGGVGPLPAVLTCSVAHRRDDLRLQPSGRGWTARGVLHRVPWGAAAGAVVALADADEEPMVALLPPASVVERGRNLADEPRDTLRYVDTPLPASSVAPAPVDRDAFLHRGALLRAAAMAGAMQRVADLTLAYAATREQFGRPIGHFQAVQHHLVAIVEETACADMAVRTAVAGGYADRIATAAAKLTAAVAARRVTRLAHQVFGAIGATEEHVLHHYSKRLWSWQDEFGTERSWAAAIGRDACDAGPEALWPGISANLVPKSAVDAMSGARS